MDESMKFFDPPELTQNVAVKSEKTCGNKGWVAIKDETWVSLIWRLGALFNYIRQRRFSIQILRYD